MAGRTTINPAGTGDILMDSQLMAFLFCAAELHAVKLLLQAPPGCLVGTDANQHQHPHTGTGSDKEDQHQAAMLTV